MGRVITLWVKTILSVFISELYRRGFFKRLDYCFGILLSTVPPPPAALPIFVALH
jgi:hypothetical protein